MLAELVIALWNNGLEPCDSRHVEHHAVCNLHLAHEAISEPARALSRCPGHAMPHGGAVRWNHGTGSAGQRRRSDRRPTYVRLRDFGG